MKLEIVTIVFVTGVSTVGACILVMIDQAVAEAAVPVRAIPQAFSLVRIRHIHFGSARTLTRGMEFDRVVASPATTRAGLFASGDIGFAAVGAIPVTHDDITQKKHLHVLRVGG